MTHKQLLLPWSLKLHRVRLRILLRSWSDLKHCVCTNLPGICYEIQGTCLHRLSTWCPLQTLPTILDIPLSPGKMICVSHSPRGIPNLIRPCIVVRYSVCSRRWRWPHTRWGTCFSSFPPIPAQASYLYQALSTPDTTGFVSASSWFRTFSLESRCCEIVSRRMRCSP